MDKILTRIFFANIQRKVVALVLALIIWMLVNHSITTTRVFQKVPVRIVNLPTEKTIRGLMPSGLLNRRLTLTLSGTKDVIEQLEPGDFEVIVDASDKGDEWVVQVGKKNLVTLNPDIDLIHHVTSVSHSEFIIKLSRLITEKIPIYVSTPKGEPPQGYQFLDVWPLKLTHTLSGPEEDIKELQARGLELSFDLSEVSKEDIDNLMHAIEPNQDEVSFPVPERWKFVSIPFLNNIKQEINGPEARNMRIDFLRKDLQALDREIPIRIFYPIKTSDSINPATFVLQSGLWVEKKNDLMLFKKPLYVKDVSRLFLDIVRERLEIAIIPAGSQALDKWTWCVQFIDPKKLEETYVTLLLSSNTKERDTSMNQPIKTIDRMYLAQREEFLRNRFREYMQKFQLFQNKEDLLKFDIHADSGKLMISDAAN